LSRALARDAAMTPPNLVTSEADHDVCERCQAVFRMSEGCPCKDCHRKHWHDEVCYPAWDAEGRRHPWGDRTHTRPGLAALIVNRLIGPVPNWSFRSLVVGIQRVRSAHAVQIWVRDLDQPGVELIKPEALGVGLNELLPMHVAFEIVDPPMWTWS
jgi:hypothetical protein